MENQKPLILVSNDDGIIAEGISELIKFLRPLGKIVVMAPNVPRSGSACALTMTEPIRYQLLRKNVELAVYKCSNTPIGCARPAFHTVFNRRSGLVVGGISHGNNSSINVRYSGTIGVVIKDCLKGMPSIGFSLCNYDQDADFGPAGTYTHETACRILEKGLPPLTCLNVNFPDTKDLKGVRVCEQAKGQWTSEWKSFTHRGDAHYYWLTGEFEDTKTGNEKSGHWVLESGYVIITPATVSVTAYGLIDELKA